ncbi:MAG: hypothetical protein EBE86_012760 [Hormoscilla sp. GUM202]|nr:hypothetical protein [Hormoscilla sp. GUM202]
MQPCNPRSSIDRPQKSPVATEIILDVEGIPGRLSSQKTCYYRSYRKNRQGSPEHIYCLVPRARSLSTSARGKASR